MTKEQKKRLDCLNKKIERAEVLNASEHSELGKLQALERLEEAKKAYRLANFSLWFSIFVLVFSVIVLVWVLLT